VKHTFSAASEAVPFHDVVLTARTRRPGLREQGGKLWVESFFAGCEAVSSPFLDSLYSNAKTAIERRPAAESRWDLVLDWVEPFPAKPRIGLQCALPEPDNDGSRASAGERPEVSRVAS